VVLSAILRITGPTIAQLKKSSSMTRRAQKKNIKPRKLLFWNQKFSKNTSKRSNYPGSS